MINRQLFILTGASRGLGAAMAEQLLDAGHSLLCISRGARAELAQQAGRRGTELEQWSLDLAQAEAAAQRLRPWLDARSTSGYSQVTLINNAAALTRIAPLSEVDLPDLAHALRVGLEAPLLLSAVFLKATEAWPQAGLTRRLLNISSGLGRRAMASQSPYCAIKAGMDHFTRCVALDEARKPHGARVCSLAPGVIDTDMQVELRGASPEQFPDLGNFTGMKDKGLLSSPGDAATRVLAYLARPGFGEPAVGDVRE